MKHKLIITVIILVFVLGGISINKYNNNSTKPVPKVTEYVVKKGDIVVGFDAEGTYLTDIVEPAFIVSGKISNINVSIGNIVKKGDILASLDSNDYFYDLTNAKATLNKAIAAHHAFEANLEKIDKSSFSDEDWKYYNEQENQLRESSRSAQALYDKSQYALNKSILYSPIEGTVIDIYFKEGETVQNQNSSNPILAILPIETKPYVEVYVEDIDVSKVMVDMKAVFIPDAVDSKKYSGKVTFISPKGITDNNGLVTYKVIVGLDSTEDLFDGFVGNVTFISKEKQGVLVIPNKAVKILDGKQYVLSSPDSDRKVNITTGFTDGKNVEVTEGLSINDKISILQ